MLFFIVYADIFHCAKDVITIKDPKHRHPIQRNVSSLF